MNLEPTAKHKRGKNLNFAKHKDLKLSRSRQPVCLKADLIDHFFLECDAFLGFPGILARFT